MILKMAVCEARMSAGRIDGDEEVQEEQMQRIQLEKNCPANIFEGFRRKEAMQTYEGIAMQFTESKGSDHTGNRRRIFV